MGTAIIIVLICLAAYIGYAIGQDKGYKSGEQDGRLDQHWYQQRVAQKTKRK